MGTVKKAIARRKSYQRAQNVWRRNMPSRMNHGRAMPDWFRTKLDTFINTKQMSMQKKMMTKKEMDKKHKEMTKKTVVKKTSKRK